MSLSQDSNIIRQKIGLFFLKVSKIKQFMKGITISLLCCVNPSEKEVLTHCTPDNWSQDLPEIPEKIAATSEITPCVLKIHF